MVFSSTKSVYIIDDSKDMQGLLKLFLEAKGHTVDCSPDGEHALQQLLSRTELPDVILLDLFMPVMDGRQFLVAKAEFPALHAIPIIVMSGDENQEVNEPLGTAQLRKPFSLSSVVSAVERQY